MLYSSAREGAVGREGTRSHSLLTRRRADRAQVEPTAALVAAIAVCLGVSLYAVALDGAIPGVDRDLAEPTLQRVNDVTSVGGVVEPSRPRFQSVLGAGPAGYELNVTVSVEDRRWTVGPPLPGTADRAQRRVSVQFGPGRIRPGTLRVGVWT